MKEKVHLINIDEISVNPNQPRQNFSKDKIIELADSIALNGLIQPIVVRLKGDGFELVAGERRMRAAKHLEYKQISAIVQNYDDQTSARIAIVENIQRENLSAIEEANAYEKLIAEHQYTQKELAQALGKSQSTVANKIRLLGLSQEVQDNIMSKVITERHGRALLKITNNTEQLKALEKILDEELNVAQTEEHVKEVVKNKVVPMRKKIISKNDYRLELNTINQALELIKNAGVAVAVETFEEDDGVRLTILLKK